jgi:hypothetical protein
MNFQYRSPKELLTDFNVGGPESLPQRFVIQICINLTKLRKAYCIIRRGLTDFHGWPICSNGR